MNANNPGATGRKAFSVTEFCLMHGISRSNFYQLLKEKRAPKIMKIGKRTLISEEAAVKWRRQMEDEAA